MTSYLVTIVMLVIIPAVGFYVSVKFQKDQRRRESNVLWLERQLLGLSERSGWDVVKDDISTDTGKTFRIKATCRDAVGGGLVISLRYSRFLLSRHVAPAPTVRMCMGDDSVKLDAASDKTRQRLLADIFQPTLNHA